MARKGKSIRVGVDLDGVLAKHSIGGLWVSLRRLKESLLKKTYSSSYYYPSSSIEKFAWKIINSRRKPFNHKRELTLPILEKNNLELYLVTSRFKFLEKLTFKWLKKYNLDHLFKKIIVNNKDTDPITFKAETVKTLNLDCFIDDDYEVVCHLQEKLNKKVYWINPHSGPTDKKKHKPIVICNNFSEALDKVIKLPN